MPRRNHYTITARLWRWPGNGGWYFVTVPHEIYTEIRTIYGKGLLRITATLGNTSWETSLLPDTKTETYLVAIKKQIRLATNTAPDDIITVEFRLHTK